jgi:hypothetical protein
VWGNLLEFPLLAKFLAEGQKGISRFRIRGLKKDGEFKKVGCLQPFYVSFFTSSISSFCPFVFTKDMVWLSSRCLPLPCFVCTKRKMGKTIIYSFSEFVSVFLSLMTFRYTEFTTYSCSLNTSVSDLCIWLSSESRVFVSACLSMLTYQEDISTLSECCLHISVYLYMYVRVAITLAYRFQFTDECEAPPYHPHTHETWCSIQTH